MLKLDSIVSPENAEAVFAKAVDGIICYKVLRNDNGKAEDFLFLSLNDSAVNLLGAPREKFIGQRFLPLFPGSLDSGLYGAFVEAAETKKIVEVEFSYKDENYEGWFKDIVIPHEDNILVFFNNITEKKMTEIHLAEKTAQLEKAREELSSSLKEKEMLLREVHHRVKNNLQIISSIVNLQMGYTEDNVTISLFRETQLRIKAIALLHQKIYENPNLASISFSLYLKDIISSIFTAFKSEDSNIILNLEIDENIEIGIDNGIYIGLILTELITNSLKHGLKGIKQGQLIIKVKKGDMITIQVADNGPGLPESFNVENTETLGMQLIFSLIEQLKGTLSIDNSEGAKFIILFPPS